jgi:hypothetical protein
MRRLICLGIVAAAVLAIPTAQAVSGPAVSLNVSKFQVRYGDSLHLAGTVSNHKAGVSVGVFSRAFTSSGFTRMATVMTDAKGGWMYDAKPGIATTYQARTGGNESRTLLVGVRPALTMTHLDNGQLRVQVGASRSFAGRSVKIQKRSAGVWSTVAKLRLNAASKAIVPSSLVPLQTTTLRATLSVNQAGQGYLGAFSTPMVLPSRWVSLTLTTPEISFGDGVKLTGRVSTRQAGTALTLLSRAAAKPEFEQLATLTSGAGGRWTFMAHPKVGTAYQAQYSGASSRVLGVGVHPDVSARIISGARVRTHVGAGRSLAGRDVQVQQLVEGQWQTIAKAKLNVSSDAIFPAAKLPGGTSTLRIAMSVNQAGGGLLGAFSRTFVYQR